MTSLVIAILRIGGLVLAAAGVIALIGILSGVGEVARVGLMNGNGGTVLAIQAMLSGVYPIAAGAALYGFAEAISLLVQIRNGQRA